MAAAAQHLETVAADGPSDSGNSSLIDVAQSQVFDYAVRKQVESNEPGTTTPLERSIEISAECLVQKPAPVQGSEAQSHKGMRRLGIAKSLAARSRGRT